MSSPIKAQYFDRKKCLWVVEFEADGQIRTAENKVLHFARKSACQQLGMSLQRRLRAIRNIPARDVIAQTFPIAEPIIDRS